MILSIIIPFYNVVECLQSCLISIAKQNDLDMECILIDDGSTDNSSLIAEDFISKNDNFLLIHKNNGGQSSARNAGINISLGDYITFVDSDDAIIGNPYSKLISILKAEKADIICMKNIIGNVPFNKDNIKTKNIINNSYKILNNYELYKGLCQITISDAPWDKVFNRNLFNFLRFKDGILNEDFLLLTKMALNPLKFIQTDIIGYYYYKRLGSTTMSGFGKNMVDALDNAKFVWMNAPKECKQAATEYFLWKMLYTIINMPIKYQIESNLSFQIIKKYIYIINSQKVLSLLTRKEAFSLWLFFKYPTLFKYLLIIYQKIKRIR